MYNAIINVIVKALSAVIPFLILPMAHARYVDTDIVDLTQIIASSAFLTPIIFFGLEAAYYRFAVLPGFGISNANTYLLHFARKILPFYLLAEVFLLLLCYEILFWSLLIAICACLKNIALLYFRAVLDNIGLLKCVVINNFVFILCFIIFHTSELEIFGSYVDLVILRCLTDVFMLVTTVVYTKKRF